MTELPKPNEARLTVREGPMVGVMLSRVVGMLAARALCPIDRLDDALLVSDAIAAHAPAHTTEGELVVTLTTDADALRFKVTPLRLAGASAVLADATLPDVGNVLERVADEIVTRHADDGTGEELRVTIGFRTPANTVA